MVIVDIDALKRKLRNAFLTFQATSAWKDAEGADKDKNEESSVVKGESTDQKEADVETGTSEGSSDEPGPELRILNPDFTFDQLSDRFTGTKDSGILYRPQEVDRLRAHVMQILASGWNKGIMVKGPHGIGKSHTLYNLVGDLLADRVFVTYIPDCEYWRSARDLLIAIAKTFGLERSDLYADELSKATEEETTVGIVFDCIKETLDGINKDRDGSAVYWVLVVDQLNRLFSRDTPRKRDVGTLPFPYFYLKTLTVHKYATCVISASVNNTSHYVDNHDGFDEFSHTLSMSGNEVKLWRKDCATLCSDDLGCMMEATGGVPLQVSKYMKCLSEGGDYEAQAVKEIKGDLLALVEEYDREGKTNRLALLKDAAVRCMLGRKIDDHTLPVHDRKYSVIRSVQRGGSRLKETFPMVLAAYREFFWEEVMTYVAENETNLLTVCKDPEVTNDVRGRLFELIVIARCQRESIVISGDPDTDVLPATVDSGTTFQGQALPEPSSMTSTLFIPINLNFPAIDIIWKSGRDVWGIQVHVVGHKDVLAKFREMCKAKGWDKAFDNIHLLYLSPCDDAMAQLTCIPPQSRRVKRPRTSKGTPVVIQVSAETKDKFPFLADIQWSPSWTSKGYTGEDETMDMTE